MPPSHLAAEGGNQGAADDPGCVHGAFSAARSNPQQTADFVSEASAVQF